MLSDVLEFHECAGRLAAEQGVSRPGPEAINCRFDHTDWVPADHGDPCSLLAQSRASVERTSGTTDICNLYISAYPIDGRLHIRSRIDASVPGAPGGAELVTLIEAILVHASVSDDLSFQTAELLATEPWRPGTRWARIDDVWVDLDFLTHRLQEHPEVSNADVREENGQVTAYVGTDLEPWELRDFLLSTDSGRNAIVSPHHFVIDRTDGVRVASSGVDRPMLAPEGAAQQSLRDAVAGANELADLTMADSYLATGSRLHLAPRVLALVQKCGFEGITVDDLRRPMSLTALAGRRGGSPVNRAGRSPGKAARKPKSRRTMNVSPEVGPKIRFQLPGSSSTDKPCYIVCRATGEASTVNGSVKCSV